MATRYEAESIDALDRALALAGVPRDHEELAGALAAHEREERARAIDAWRRAIDEVALPAPRAMPRVAPPDAPDRLVDVVVAHALGSANDHEVRYDVDDYVTGREGWRACHRSCGAGALPWEADRLAIELEREARERDLKIDPARVAVASKKIAARTRDVGWYVALPASDERTRLGRALGAIEPGPNPFGPVGALATRFSPREIAIDRPRPMHLRYVDVGDRGAPVLLLLHGHSSRLEELDELAARAAGRFRVVMCDLPGCGYSDHPLIEYSIGLYEEVLWSFLDALGIHSFSVAGGSLGGNLALRLALSRPDRVERAIPWAPVGWWEPEPLLALGARLFLHAPEPLFWVSLRKQAGAWFHPGWEGRDAALADALAYREEVYGPAYHAAYFEIAAEQTETTMRQRAREIRVPTLLMVGEHDSKLGMREGVPILAAEMGAPHVIIAGAAHSIANEKTDEVARHLLAFLAG